MSEYERGRAMQNSRRKRLSAVAAAMLGAASGVPALASTFSASVIDRATGALADRRTARRARERSKIARRN